MAAEKREIDWEAIETAYRIGKPSIRVLAKDQGVNPATITRRAKKEGWTRDLSVLVKAETKARVSAHVVEEAHKTHTARIRAHAGAVEVEAISNALMIAEHEKVGTKSRELFAKIIERIAEQVEETPSVQQLVSMVAEAAPEAEAGFRKLMAIPSLVDSAKKATEGAAKAVEIERKARNLDDAPPSAIESIADAIRKARDE